MALLPSPIPVYAQLLSPFPMAMSVEFLFCNCESYFKFIYDARQGVVFFHCHLCLQKLCCPVQFFSIGIFLISSLHIHTIICLGRQEYMPTLPMALFPLDLPFQCTTALCSRSPQMTGVRIESSPELTQYVCSVTHRWKDVFLREFIRWLYRQASYKWEIRDTSYSILIQLNNK